MQVTGMLYGSKLLQFVGFPSSEILGPDASEEEIKALIDRHGSVFVKPVFKGGVGKKGKAGLLGHAKDLKTRPPMPWFSVGRTLKPIHATGSWTWDVVSDAGRSSSSDTVQRRLLESTMPSG